MRSFCGVLAAALVFLAGCGGKGGSGSAETHPEELRPIRDLTVTLDGLEGPENVGILMAQKRGYFADAHLSVTVNTPALPTRPVNYVATRIDDLGVGPEPQVVLARDNMEPVVAVGSLISQPTAAMIWLKKSHIGGIADLKGKTIAIPGFPFQESFLQSVLARSGLTLKDVEVKRVGYGLVPALVSGRADAIFGGSWNLEGVQLESRGLEPVVTRVQELGIPPYDEFVVVARADRVTAEPGLIQDFVSAVVRGNAAAAENPRAAVNAIMEAGLGGSDVSRGATEAEVVATSPLLSGSGYLDPEQASRLVDWMYEQRMIQRKPPVSALLGFEQ
jgi:putative hydroxymethylpyrimidine transport system substrate-binding protein